MGDQPLRPPHHHRRHARLGHQLEIGRDGPPGLQRALDSTLEVARHVGRVEGEDLEDGGIGEAGGLGIVRVEGEEVEDGGGVEFEEEVGEGEDEELEKGGDGDVSL